MFNSDCYCTFKTNILICKPSVIFLQLKSKQCKPPTIFWDKINFVFGRGETIFLGLSKSCATYQSLKIPKKSKIDPPQATLLRRPGPQFVSTGWLGRYIISSAAGALQLSPRAPRLGRCHQAIQPIPCSPKPVGTSQPSIVLRIRNQNLL